MNENFQFSTDEDKFYHEAFSHMPMMMLNKIPQNVLVLGAGDGLLVRELIKHSTITDITLIELDGEMQRLALEEKHASARRKTLERELEWLRMAPRARQAKSKARISAYEQLAAEDGKAKEGSVEILIPPGPRLGDVVIEAKGISKAYGDKLLIDDLSFSLPPGGIVGVIGANGAGKTTLFRMIVGEDQPDAGELKLGETVKLAYVDQSRDALDAEKNIWEEKNSWNAV